MIRHLLTSQWVLWTLALMSIILAVSVGQYEIPLATILSELQQFVIQPDNSTVASIEQQIIVDIRLPRILIAFISGAGLALTGVILQTITRNPLADPYLFGISAGASLGAVIILAMSLSIVYLSVGAMLGSLLAVLLILSLAGRFAGHIESLVLAGVAVSFMLSSFTSIVLYHSDPNVVASLLFWMMGSFDHIGWSDLPIPSLVLIVTLIFFISVHRWLDAMLAGDEMAQALGINTRSLRIVLMLVAALLTATLVAKVGGIGFVGLMIPHICRILVGHQIKGLLFCSVVVGGIFMVWADMLARLLLQDQQLPIGIITAAIGSLFFILLLKQQQRKTRST